LMSIRDVWVSAWVARLGLGATTFIDHGTVHIEEGIVHNYTCHRVRRKHARSMDAMIAAEEKNIPGWRAKRVAPTFRRAGCGGRGGHLVTSIPRASIAHSLTH
jgi:hypothetical protein